MEYSAQSRGPPWIPTLLRVSTPPAARKSKHSHHEEDASSVWDAASCDWGGIRVIANNATQHAQEIKNYDENQEKAGNQATQPPGETSTMLLYIKRWHHHNTKAAILGQTQLSIILGNDISEALANSSEGDEKWCLPTASFPTQPIRNLNFYLGFEAFSLHGHRIIFFLCFTSVELISRVCSTSPGLRVTMSLKTFMFFQDS